jgi:hypothetical protein
MQEEQRSNNKLQRVRRTEPNEDARAGGEILVERDRKEVPMPFSPPEHPPCLCCWAQGFSALKMDTRLHVEAMLCHC